MRRRNFLGIVVGGAMGTLLPTEVDAGIFGRRRRCRIRHRRTACPPAMHMATASNCVTCPVYPTMTFLGICTYYATTCCPPPFLSFVGPLYDAPGLQCGSCMQIGGMTLPPGGCRSTLADGSRVPTERTAAAVGAAAKGNPAMNDDIWNNGFPSLLDDPSKILFPNAASQQGQNRFKDVDNPRVGHSFAWYEWSFGGVVFFRAGYEIADDPNLPELSVKRHGNHKHLHKAYLQGDKVPIWIATVKSP